MILTNPEDITNNSCKRERLNEDEKFINFYISHITSIYIISWVSPKKHANENQYEKECIYINLTFHSLY